MQLDNLGLDEYEKSVARFMLAYCGEKTVDEETVGELLLAFENDDRYQVAYAAR